MREKLLYILLLFVAFVVNVSAAGHVAVRGYTRKDGTYVAPHYRSSPNRTTLDNWSTRGNVDPYTGAVGTRSPAFAGGGGSIVLNPNQPVLPQETDQRPSIVLPPVTRTQAAQPKPARVLTTNDLPKSEFSGELFDERKTVLLYQAREAEKGNPEALYAMGIRFSEGIDVPKHANTAREYLEAAKKKGNLRTREKLSQLDRERAAMAKEQEATATQSAQ